MKDIKIGEYVRIKNGINKIIYIDDIFGSDGKHSFYTIRLDNDNLIFDDEIIKSSPDIIDLIKVGDVIVGKDNHKFEVYAVGSDCVYINELKEFILVKDIKGIVTKEQFSQMECRIGE